MRVLIKYLQDRSPCANNKWIKRALFPTTLPVHVHSPAIQQQYCQRTTHHPGSDRIERRKGGRKEELTNMCTWIMWHAFTNAIINILNLFPLPPTLCRRTQTNELYVVSSPLLFENESLKNVIGLIPERVNGRSCRFNTLVIVGSINL